MGVGQLLESKRAPIIDRWRELVVGTYPAQASRLLDRTRDQFRNPVGHAINESVVELYDGLVGEGPVSDLREAVDRVVRIRAVQDFIPSEAVGFVMQVKQAVRDEARAGGISAQDEMALRHFDARVDELALLAFDVYSSCREQMMVIRSRALERRTSHLLKLAQRLGDPYACADAISSETDLEGGPGA